MGGHSAAVYLAVAALAACVAAHLQTEDAWRETASEIAKPIGEPSGSQVHRLENALEYRVSLNTLVCR